MKRASRLRRARPQRARCRSPRTPKRSRTPLEGSNEVAAVPGADDERVLPSEPRATLAETAERESPASPRSEDAVSCGTAVLGPPRPARPLGSHLGQAAYSGTSPSQGARPLLHPLGVGSTGPWAHCCSFRGSWPWPRTCVCVTFAEEEFQLILSPSRLLWPSRPPLIYLHALIWPFSKIFSAPLSYFVACLRLLSWSSSSRLL